MTARSFVVEALEHSFGTFTRQVEEFASIFIEAFRLAPCWQDLSESCIKDPDRSNPESAVGFLWKLFINGGKYLVARRPDGVPIGFAVASIPNDGKLAELGLAPDPAIEMLNSVDADIDELKRRLLQVGITDDRRIECTLKRVEELRKLDMAELDRLRAFQKTLAADRLSYGRTVYLSLAVIAPEYQGLEGRRKLSIPDGSPGPYLELMRARLLWGERKACRSVLVRTQVRDEPVLRTAAKFGLQKAALAKVWQFGGFTDRVWLYKCCGPDELLSGRAG